MNNISTEQIFSQIREFWNAFSCKPGTDIEGMYMPSAIAISSFGRRSEPARLMLARRMRKFSGQSSVTAELGPVDAQLAGDVAIVSYPYRFHSFSLEADGSCEELDMPHSRATHVLQLDQHGIPRIVHEHLSLAEPGKKTVTPADQHPALPSRTGLIGLPQVRVVDTPPSPAANPLSVDEIQALVRKAWHAFQRKSKDEIDAEYFPTAIFMAMDGRRSETARLAIMRRAREFCSSRSSMSVDIGAIDVQSAGGRAAIASYNFNFRAVRVVASGKRMQYEIKGCRATTVFVRDDAGAPRILHEHQSAIEVGVIKELPEEVLAHT